MKAFIFFIALCASVVVGSFLQDANAKIIFMFNEKVIHVKVFFVLLVTLVFLFGAYIASMFKKNIYKYMGDIYDWNKDRERKKNIKLIRRSILYHISGKRELSIKNCKNLVDSSDFGDENNGFIFHGLWQSLEIDDFSSMKFFLQKTKTLGKDLKSDFGFIVFLAEISLAIENCKIKSGEEKQAVILNLNSLLFKFLRNSQNSNGGVALYKFLDITCNNGFIEEYVSDVEEFSREVINMINGIADKCSRADMVTLYSRVLVNAILDNNKIDSVKTISYLFNSLPKSFKISESVVFLFVIKMRNSTNNDGVSKFSLFDWIYKRVANISELSGTNLTLLLKSARSENHLQKIKKDIENTEKLSLMALYAILDLKYLISDNAEKEEHERSINTIISKKRQITVTNK